MDRCDRGEGLLTSGQMAKASGVTEKALYLYQRKGILEPTFIEESTGRRYYDIQQSTKLDMVLHLQQVGFSLDEIRQIADRQDARYLDEQVKDRIVAIREQMRELELAERLARQLKKDCELFLHPPIVGECIIENLPERRVVPYDVDEPERLRRDSPANNAAEWEWATRQVRRRILDRDGSSTRFYNLACLIPLATMEARSPLKCRIAAFVDEGQEDPAGAVEILPGGSHLVMYLDQAYDDQGKELDTDRLLRMMDYIEAKRLKMVGDTYGESLFRFPRLFTMGGSMLYRLCIPVARG